MKICRFLSTLHVQIGKILKKSNFSNFYFCASDILSLKSIQKWPGSLIFIEIHPAVFEKPIIFNFVRFLSWPRDEIQKSVPYIFFSVPFSIGWKKPHDDIWNGYCAMLAESLGPPKKKSTLEKWKIALRFRRAGRVWCGGARGTHWATCHNGVTVSKTKQSNRSSYFSAALWYMI